MLLKYKLHDQVDRVAAIRGEASPAQSPKYTPSNSSSIPRSSINIRHMRLFCDSSNRPSPAIWFNVYPACAGSFSDVRSNRSAIPPYLPGSQMEMIRMLSLTTLSLDSWCRNCRLGGSAAHVSAGPAVRVQGSDERRCAVRKCDFRYLSRPISSTLRRHQSSPASAAFPMRQIEWLLIYEHD